MPEAIIDAMPEAMPKAMPKAMIDALPAAGDLVQVRVVDLLVTSPGKSPMNAFYAAGMAVLFLLFSVTGIAGILLEEERNGTLERLLCSNLSMGALLVGRWLFATLLGVVQISVMFLWGALAFGVDLFTPRHLAGFGLMTLATASAAASFGIFLATLCRTRSQLDGVGTITILIMSALGGSMFPRFLMPAWMKQVGLLTFNAWAVDGYQKVFWYEQEPLALWPQLGVLAGVTMLLLLVARRLARRWDWA
jgi:ABC-2 type transport system permease protein